MAAAVVYLFFENLTRFEREHSARINRNRLSGLWVAAAAGAFAIDDETAKARDLDLLAFTQSIPDDREHFLNHLARFLPRRAHALVNQSNQIRFRHPLLRHDWSGFSPTVFGEFYWRNSALSSANAFCTT